MALYLTLRSARVELSSSSKYLGSREQQDKKTRVPSKYKVAAAGRHTALD